MAMKLLGAAALVFSVAVVPVAGFQIARAQTATAYQKPPAAIEQLLDAPETPLVSVSPNRKMLLIEQPASFPTIADVAQPRLRLAGIRFNPVASAPAGSGDSYSISLKLQGVEGGAARAVTGLPAKLKATNAMWSPDSKHVVFVQRVDASAPGGPGLQLWVIDAASGAAHRVGLVKLNGVLGSPCAWMPDSAAVLCHVVPVRGAAPRLSDVPAGPNVEENLGKATPAPTYEDMLKTAQDADQFEYYSTSQLAIVPLTGPVKLLPVKGLIDTARPSPDGKYALVDVIHRPFGFTVPYERFPRKTEIVTLKTGTAKDVYDRPLVDNLPISRDAVEPGPRDYQWRSDVPATLVWVEAANNGMPVKEGVADRIMALPAPFEGKGEVIYEASLRISRGGFGGARGIEWGNDHLALVTEARFSDRKTMMVAFDPSAVGKTKTLYAGSSQDRYKNPGRPMTMMNATGQMVLKLTGDGTGIYFSSLGSSPTGDRPFVGVMPVGGGAEKILVRSADPYYDEPVALLSDDKVLIRRESAARSPNYFAEALTGGAAVQVTQFASPYAGINMPTKQLLKYKRKDGVDLTATLWVPYGYDKSQGPLPTLMEAYPAEFKTRSAASQVAGSPNRFPRINWGSPVYFAQVGYAVLQDASIPIIGEGDSQPNDTYVEQLVDGAKAAVDYGVSLGVVDPKRVAVMGHSYGAFMTANLLAHTNIFRAGIARSGAYNRTLTPYGFQNEERTYWQDPKVYFDMSPFSYADKIKTPILLIHGEADDNTGTYPIQSERFYAALKGQGATVRLVFLPLEAHHYVAHESLQHMLWEMDRWLDTYVKPVQ
ncbi:S9 family peptidase [Granulicella tundricola]|uniref:Peptidase S9 prolyl oligopeptidase active site domain protein n=1 Tax=Granulicella tundricola (strain ATCC BAA-1859 / DSM 23138 / MP5ACTX9) TaxID=1198114 RepID=E8WWV2_GRATM|nr:prolyl oligopeptidase family serine peptidase [Granulicella tundricola]ADW67430.1 peptidase S9 prolyl oligopeptidase active site domain protein [Granulicella tundricola MP5ACTX9]